MFFAPHEVAIQPLTGSCEEPDQRAARRIRSVLLAGHPTILAFSSGKDSTVLASITLIVARELKEAGHRLPPIFVAHSQTGVEQPEVSLLAKQELAKIEAYAGKHGIGLRVLLAAPALADMWGPRVLGGRALPAFPDGNADCSTSWKVQPTARLIKKAMKLKENAGWAQPVVMTGVRNSESTHRDQNIAKRGETAEGLWQNEFGQLRASPLLDLTEDDIWSHIGYCTSGVIESYSG